jgi:hypothetical protein
VILEIILPDHRASAEGEELKDLLAVRNAASRPLPAHVGRDEQAVPEVQEFLGIEANVLEALKHASPNFQVAVMAVKGPAYVEEYLGPVKLDVGIKASEEQIEIASVRRRECLTYATHKDRAAQPRVAWQSRPRSIQPPGNCGEADDNPFIQSPVPPRLRCERDADTAHDFHVLLRHRPLSIPQLQESA